MSEAEEYKRMKAALTNILDVSSDDFSRHQARWGLGIKRTCPACSGSGYFENTVTPRCTLCNGKGVIQ